MSALRQTATENLIENQPKSKVWTDAEFMALPRDGHRYELVNGELIDMGNSGAKHGYVAIFLEGTPDLAIEILSPGNTVAEIHDKLVEYFENDARLVWVIHPNEHYVLVYRSAREPDRLLKSTDFLDGEEVVPGFSFPVANLFQKLNF